MGSMLYTNVQSVIAVCGSMKIRVNMKCTLPGLQNEEAQFYVFKLHILLNLRILVRPN